ncbi:MAG: ABC transporter permease [Nocardioidaceae bacterium]
MSTTTGASETVDQETALELRTAQAHGTSWLGWLVQPAVIVAMLVGVVIYVQTAKLGTVEARALSLDSVRRLTVQHIQVSFMAAALVVVIAVPVGILLTRSFAKRGTPFVIAFANAGQAIPSIGLLVLLALWWKTGFWTAVLALTIYGILPSLRNTIVGLQQVDQRLVEAGRGMGMSAVRVLGRVELPLAVPVILTGVRVSLVLIVGTAALATFVGAGGLGGLVVTGINLGRGNVLIVGAILIAALALLIDWLGRVVEEIARPKGL